MLITFTFTVNVTAHLNEEQKRDIEAALYAQVEDFGIQETECTFTAQGAELGGCVECWETRRVERCPDCRAHHGPCEDDHECPEAV
jgi:hypothetical protein